MIPHRPMLYVLDDQGEAMPMEQPPDLEAWARAMDSPTRILAQDRVGDVLVSTVFLGTDYGWGSGPPVVWETALFRPGDTEIVARYSSRAAAQAGHEKALESITPKV